MEKISPGGARGGWYGTGQKSGLCFLGLLLSYLGVDLFHVKGLDLAEDVFQLFGRQHAGLAEYTDLIPEDHHSRN